MQTRAASAGSGRGKSKRTYHHGDLRRELVEAAFEIAQRNGPEAITLRAVASKAGVSEAAPYHHFRDKRLLLAAAAGAGFELLDTRFARALARAPADPAQGLAALAGAYVAFALEEPGPYRLVIGAHVAELDLGGMPESGVHGRTAKARMRALARECVASGVKCETETLFRLVWGLAHGLASLVLERELDHRGVAAPGVASTVAMAHEAVLRLIAGYRVSLP